MSLLIVWILHFPAGSVAICSVLAAFYFPKGSFEHRRAGNVFTIAMIVMLLSGGIAGGLKHSADDVFLAALVLYIVFTAWLTVYRRPGESGLLEKLALIYVLGLGLGAGIIDHEWDWVRDANFYTAMSVFAALFALGDLYHIRSKGLRVVPRLARHVWRHGFSLFWVVLAFGDKLIKMLGSTLTEMRYVPFGTAVLVLCVTLYWLGRVRMGFQQLLTNEGYRR